MQSAAIEYKATSFHQGPSITGQLSSQPRLYIYMKMDSKKKDQHQNGKINHSLIEGSPGVGRRS